MIYALLIFPCVLVYAEIQYPEIHCVPKACETLDRKVYYGKYVSKSFEKHLNDGAIQDSKIYLLNDFYNDDHLCENNSTILHLKMSGRFMQAFN